MSSVTFNREQIAEYAEASEDRNPIHLDDDFAKSVGLPSLIAHGMLQMGLLANEAARAAGGAANLRRLKCRFAAVVQPGDTITFTAMPTGDKKIALTATNQRGESTLTKAEAETF